jgi:hypothetical protein
MANSGWVPPEKPPRRTGWRRWLRAVLSGLLANFGTVGLLQWYASDVRHEALDNIEANVALLAAWVVGSVVTGLVAEARSIVEWVLAFALLTGVLIAFYAIAAWFTVMALS